MKRGLKLCLILLTQFKGHHHMDTAGYETLTLILMRFTSAILLAARASYVFPILHFRHLNSGRYKMRVFRKICQLLK
jgi:hypothetical protein